MRVDFCACTCISEITVYTSRNCKYHFVENELNTKRETKFISQVKSNETHKHFFLQKGHARHEEQENFPKQIFTYPSFRMSTTNPDPLLL